MNQRIGINTAVVIREHLRFNKRTPPFGSVYAKQGQAKNDRIKVKASVMSNPA